MSDVVNGQRGVAVKTRRVFYIPGYDPFPPRRYRELYRRESALQAKISGYEIALAPKSARGGDFGWHIRATIGGQRTETDMDVLVWSDIVRDSMGAGIAATYAQMARTAWIYIASGTLWRLMWLRKGPVIAALYPVVMLLGQLALALALMWLTMAAVRQLGFGLAQGWAHALGLVAGAGLGIGLLHWFRARDGRFLAYYLMHDYAFSARYRGANPPALEARIAEFGDKIAQALASDVDEVLVIGHSSGAHLVVSILADLIRAGRVPAGGAALGFLSLGQVIPMVSFLPEATRLRRDLHDLSRSDQLAWIDISAPGDGCSFALCDPVAVSGVAPDHGKRWPLVVSAAFTKTLRPETWAALRWRFFRLHFQYLCAFDAPGDYDYFQITAGPKTLAARYAGRAPSRSRVDVAASRYTGRAA